MYGKGVRAKDAKEAAAFAGIYMGDRMLMRARAAAGLDVLRRRKEVDTARLAAIGYCFGEPRFSNWPVAGRIWPRWQASTGC